MRGISRLKSIAKDTGKLLLNPRFLGPCLAGAFCLTVATVVGITYLFTMSTALLSLPVASYIIGMVMMRGWKVSRQSRYTATQGDRTAVTVRLSHSRGLLPEDISVRDSLPQFITCDEPDGVTPNEGTDSEVRIWIQPLKRGRYTIGPLEISVWDPLGMFKLRKKIGDTSELIVYPKPVRIRLTGLARGIAEASLSTGSDTKSSRGNFAGVRDYRKGDELRRIHWRTTARTGKLAVVEYEDSSEESIQIAVDLSKGSDFGKGLISSLDTAVGAAAYAVKENLSAGRQVRLVMPNSENANELTLGCIHDLPVALTALADAKADASMSAAELLRACANHGDVLLITARSDSSLATAVRDAVGRDIKVSVAFIQPADYNSRIDAKSQLDELARSGADVEVVRGGSAQ